LQKKASGLRDVEADVASELASRVCAQVCEQLIVNCSSVVRLMLARGYRDWHR
jgi:hypothetical protein